MGRVSEKRAARRAAILAATVPLVQRQGFFATGVQDLADAASLPKGSFFNYFRSKEDFALAAIEVYTAEARRQSERVLLNESQSPLTRVRALYAERIAYARRQITLRESCLLNVLAQEGSTPAIARALSAALREIRAPLTQCLQQAARAGLLQNVPDAETLAEFLENSWRGTLLVALGRRSELPLDAFEQSLTAFLGNMAPRGSTVRRTRKFA